MVTTAATVVASFATDDGVVTGASVTWPPLRRFYYDHMLPGEEHQVPVPCLQRWPLRERSYTSRWPLSEIIHLFP